MSTVISVVISIIATWVVAHYYYRRQTREQINPMPQLQEVHRALIELYGVAIDRKDEQLQKLIKRLVIEMVNTRVRILNKLSAPLLFLAMIKDALKPGKEEALESLMPHLPSSVEMSVNSISGIADEFDASLRVAEEIAGKKAHEIVTLKELLENLYKDKKRLKE